MDGGRETLAIKAIGSGRHTGNVTAESAIKIMQAMLGAVAANAKHDFPKNRQPLDLVVVEASIGSFRYALRSSSPDPAIGLMVASANRDVVRQSMGIAAGQDRKTLGPTEAVRHIETLMELASGPDVDSIHVVSGDLEAVIAPRLDSARFTLLVDRSIGSVEGTIMGVTFAGARPQFTLKSLLNGNLVNCFFEDALEGQVVAALKQRVLVSGVVMTRADGELVSITDIDLIYRFRPDDDLPSIERMIGVDPGMTEGLPSEEWVRRDRDRR